ncbi:MAG: hypothetical protein PF505_12735, partial [Vallitaleaceae bacterium]|jgi:putative ABC transport system permease protein|nr:hypothetical protein [Vallitaleaceae bacterium]
VFEPSDASEFYWSENLFSNLKSAIILDSSDLNNMITKNDNVFLNNIVWREFYDYHSLEIKDIEPSLKLYKAQEAWALSSARTMFLDYNIITVLDGFSEQSKVLEITLWILTIPVLIITMFYTFMISRLIVKNDENEIAMLKSRGAGTFQIFSMYIIQSVFMGGIAFIVGPIVALAICRIIGASNGFMEFVSRVSLPVEITFETRMYALVAVIVYLIFILIPAYVACKTSIVQYKRAKNAIKPKALWEKMFLDIIILGVAYYGYYSYNISKSVLGQSVSSGEKVDPLIFLVSTLFLLGANLLILRIYPYIIRFIYYVGKKLWSPVMYFTLINVGRAEYNSRFIMLFIMLSLSFGILNSSQARTLNLNTVDRVLYHNGADIVIDPFKEDEATGGGIYVDLFAASNPSDGLNHVVESSVNYEAYKTLDGVKSMSRVISNNEAIVKKGSSSVLDMQLMAFTPHEFIDTTWYRNDLLPAHINSYMNMMTQAPIAAVLSTDMRDVHNMEVGDEILVIWEGATINAIVYAFIEYFPTYNPYTLIEDKDDEKAIARYEKVPFVMLNLDYIDSKLPSQDYTIWIDKEEGVTDRYIQEQLIDKDLEATDVVYTTQELISAKNAPLLQGTNGILTMCFIITMVITFIGYLIFWIMAMKGRALKFGIFRAMGMSMNQVTKIIVYEQILMTGAAIGFGFSLGIVASKIFVPMLQMVESAESQVPPFIVVLLRRDYLQTLGIAGAMLLVGLVILFIIVRRFKVNQVLKLGED